MVRDMAGKIDFAQQGIATAIEQRRLAVPLNQREYSWEEEHAQTLFQDLSGALGRHTYFLGTIVLTRTGIDGGLEVADGQQRLATVTMLLSAIRDYYLANESMGRAQGIESQYLLKISRLLAVRSERTGPWARLRRPCTALRSARRACPARRGTMRSPPPPRPASLALLGRLELLAERVPGFLIVSDVLPVVDLDAKLPVRLRPERVERLARHARPRLVAVCFRKTRSIRRAAARS